jgi:hypothetical protein
MFGKPDKKKTVEIDGKQVELEPKPGAMSKLFGGKKPAEQKPQAPPTPPPKPQPTKPAPPLPEPSTPKFVGKDTIQVNGKEIKLQPKPSPI